MKRTSLLMKLLIILPVFLLAALLVWIAADGRRHGVRETVAAVAEETAAKTMAAAAEVPAAETAAAAEASIAETAASTEEVLKLQLGGSEEETTALTEETEPEDPVVHLLFGGDIYFSSHVIAAYDKAGGIHGVLDDAFRAEIGKADLFMANQEFPFSDRGTPAPDKQFTFRVPPVRVTMMKELGVDIVTIANNHTLDYGTDALVDTCTTLEEAGIPYVGAGVNMDRAKQLETLEVRGRTIGFLAGSRVYPDTSWVANSRKPGMVSGYDPTILLEEIKKAGELCDYLVVYMHWGIEREEKPKDYQRSLGKQLIDAGADLVIGSHPHVLQGIEYYKGKPIVYSLGNFVFGSSIPKTALLRADVDLDQEAVSLSLIPGTSGAGYTRELTDPAKLSEFYQYFQSISFGAAVAENGVVREEAAEQ